MLPGLRGAQRNVTKVRSMQTPLVLRQGHYACKFLDEEYFADRAAVLSTKGLDAGGPQSEM